MDVAYVAGFGCASLGSASACGTLGACGPVAFDFDPKKGSGIDKGKKATVSVKFTVAVPDAAASHTPASESCGAEISEISADLAALNATTVTNAAALAAIADADAAQAAKAAEAAAAKAAAETEAAVAKAAAASGAAAEMVVDPWSVEGKIDYDKLIEKFG